MDANIKGWLVILTIIQFPIILGMIFQFSSIDIDVKFLTRRVKSLESLKLDFKLLALDVKTLKEKYKQKKEEERLEEYYQERKKKESQSDN